MADYPASDMIGRLTPAAAADPDVFSFIVQEITEHAALHTKDGTSTAGRLELYEGLALFGAVFQREDRDAAAPKRVCVGRVEIRPSQAANLKIGGFCFSDDTDVQPFLYARLNVTPDELSRLRDVLRTGHDIKLTLRAETATRLRDLIEEEARLPADQRGAVRVLASASLDVKR